jgi:hypothetical protein
MADLPHPWDMYARLQAELSRGCQVGDESWGAEAALNRILLSLQDNSQVTSDDLARTTASERRRERYRARLRRIHVGADEPGADPSEALAARDTLRIAGSMVSNQDWGVLRQLAEGYSYAEVAAQTGSSSGRLRVRVLRCRQRLAAIAA